MVREGDEAPGTGGAVFRSLTRSALNDAGETAFRSRIVGDGDFGILTSSGLVAREGDVAPGTDGAKFQALFADVALNNLGETAFSASISDDSGIGQRAIFTSSGLVARQGDVAPGTDGASFATVFSPSLNDAGEVAFSATLGGTGVAGTNRFSIFLSDAAGKLGLIVRQGMDIDLGDGDLRTVSFLRPGVLNDRGELAFVANFTNGSQAIVIADTRSAATEVIPLPAPMLLLLSGLAGLGLLRGRRRRHDA